MRIIVVLFFFLTWSSKIFSQDLTGEWGAKLDGCDYGSISLIKKL